MMVPWSVSAHKYGFQRMRTLVLGPLAFSAGSAFHSKLRRVSGGDPRVARYIRIVSQNRRVSYGASGAADYLIPH